MPAVNRKRTKGKTDMNRIFKTVWNVARKALVVVNEKAGIGQSRCTAVGTGSEVSTSSVTVEHKKSFGVPSGLVMALAGVFVLWGGSVEAAKTFPTDCASVGGTMKDGVCYIGDGTQTDTVVEVVNDEWTLTEGDMTISGGSKDSANGISYNASKGGTGTISNTGSGTLTIMGGSHMFANGIYINAYGSGSTGAITNTGEGTLIISGGSGEYTYGIQYNAYSSGSTGTISNLGTGTLSITGGSYTGSYGIYAIANLNGAGNITNEGKGTLIISGGIGTKAYGIKELAESRGTGTISNAGSGTLIISGGRGLEAHGIYRLALYAETTGKISNGEEGTLNILGNLKAGSYGIGIITANGQIENSGVMNLNENAIQSFGSGKALVTNKATGTVNAEAEAIFQATDSVTSVENVGISVYVPGKGIQSTTVDGYAMEVTTSTGWKLKDDWANHSVWEDGGKLVITDVSASSSAAQEIKTAFEEKFGTGTTVSFIGEEEGNRPDFTADHVHSMIKAGSVTDGTVIVSETLTGIGNDIVWIGKWEVPIQPVDPENPDIDPNASLADFELSTGFKSLTGFDQVYVNLNKSFTLVGGNSLTEDIAGGAAVRLDNGNFRMGLKADGLAETKGSVTKVAMNGDSSVQAENGIFKVDSLTGHGKLSVDESAGLHVKNVEITGNVSNAGTLSVDSLNVKGNIESSKTLKTAGTITVDAGSKLSVNGAVVADSIKVDGVVVLGSNAQVFTGAAAMDQLRKANAEAAAEIDRLENPQEKTEVSTMSVLDRIVAESMKRPESEDTDSNQGEGDSSASSGSSSTGTVITSHRRAAPVLPLDAQAFAAFDAVKRIASDIERGTNPDGHGLWVKLQTNESEFGVRSGTKFEVESDGAVVGAEAKLNPSVKVGGAVSYLDGEIDAGAGKTNWTSYGLHGYVQFKEGAFGVKGTAGWLRGTTETAEDFDADVWHAGVRAEYDLPAGSMTFTPFVGARVMSGSFDGLDSQTTFSLPVGVALSGTLTTGGWTIVPSFEAAYVRSMGDTEAEDVRILAKDSLEGTLSLKATKGEWTGELSYRGATGGRDYDGRAFMAKIGMTF